MSERTRGGDGTNGRRKPTDGSEDSAELDTSAEVEAVDDESVEDVDETDEDGTSGRGGTATKVRTKNATTTDKKPTKDKGSSRPNIFVRFVTFIREIVSELRKVIWPTRSELLTYTAVVVVFVAIVLTVVGLLDYGFAKAVLWVFGNKASTTDAN